MPYLMMSRDLQAPEFSLGVKGRLRTRELTEKSTLDLDLGGPRGTPICRVGTTVLSLPLPSVRTALSVEFSTLLVGSFVGAGGSCGRDLSIIMKNHGRLVKCGWVEQSCVLRPRASKCCRIGVLSR